MNKSIEIFFKISLIIVLFICINSIVGDIAFRLQYCHDKISNTTTKVINTNKEPVQIELDSKEFIKAYGEKYKYLLEPQAKYSIAGLVVAKNSNFWFRDVLRSRFDDIALIDFGMAWGELAQDKDYLYNHLTFKSHKTLGMARQLSWKSVPPHDIKWDWNYINSHISHTHIIPANNNIMSALLRVKKNDIIKLDGFLVDIYDEPTSQVLTKTSLSRTDTNATSRGYGACEVMYVKKIQIKDRIYE